MSDIIYGIAFLFGQDRMPEKRKNKVEQSGVQIIR